MGAVTYPRQLAMYLLVEGGATLQEAAEAVGRVSHTSARYAYEKIKFERSMKYADVCADLAALEGEA